MAEVLFYKIQFTGSNPYGEYVAGDVVDIYYDVDLEITPTESSYSSTQAIKVKKNGVTITSGANIYVLENGYKTGQYTQLNICLGTTKVSPVPTIFGTFPYAWANFFHNHPECELNPETCDLFFTGIPAVTHPTQLEPLGSIVVAASSSYPIQYKLGSDFIYNDGTGQESGTFVDLDPGIYKIYARDSKNCGTYISVQINSGNFYNPVYRLEYDDPVGGVTRVDVVRLGYGGEITEVKGANIAFERSLKGEASQDKFTPMLATKATLNLTSETNFQFIDIYTNNPEEYRFHYYKNSTIGGIYKVLPQQYGEDYKAAPYYTSIVATDGLPEISEFLFLQHDGLPFAGKIKAIELIAFCLKKTGLDLNIRCAINMYATGMNTTDADDPLDQVYIDPKAIYLSTDKPTVTHALTSILEPFGARIIQENAVWNIVRVEEMRAEYDYREFDPDGVYVSNSSFDPILDIAPVGQPGFYFSDRNHYMTLCPGYGKIIVKYNLGLKTNILENGDFRLKPTISTVFNTYVFDIDKFGWQLINGGYPINEGYEPIDESNIAYKLTGREDTTGDAYLLSDVYNVKMGANNTLKINVRYKLPPPLGISTRPGIFGESVHPLEVKIPYQKIRMVVTYGDKYLRADGLWSDSENELIFYQTKYSEYVDSEIIARQPDEGAVDGYDFQVKLYHSYIYHAENANLTALRAKPTASLPLGTRTQMVGTIGGNPAIYYYTLTETTEAEGDPLTVRPNDYDVTDNPVRWDYEAIVNITYFDDFQTPFWIDHVSVEMLSDGNRPTDSIIREINGEPRNKYYLEKDLIFGSYSNIVTTLSGIKYFGAKSYLYVGAAAYFNYGPTPQPVTITTDVLSADLLFTGFFRSSEDVGHETWTRDGIAESDTIHGIFLKMYAAQYRKSFRKLTGSFYSDNTYFSFLNVIRVVNDGNRLYLPISPTIDDKNNRVTGEFLELTDITLAGNSSVPFSRGFTSGFGSSFR